MNNIQLGISQSRGYENANLELIKVTTNEQGQKLVSGRELHEVLEIGTQFTKWIQRMIDYGFIEGTDFTAISQKRLTAQGNATEFTDYILTLDMAKHIAMVQRTEIGMKVRNYFIECEKVAKEQKPVSQLDAIIAGLQATKELHEKMEVVEQVQVQQQQAIQNIRNVVAINTTDWRKDTTNIINRIAMSRDGGADNIHTIRKESYDLLEKRANCKLSVRRTNLQRVMLENGVSKSKVDKVNYLDVIDRDNRLKEIYIAIVKEMAIKYNVA